MTPSDASIDSSSAPESTPVEGAPALDRPLAPGPEPTPLEPVREGERIASIDVLRGFALLGILLMNIEQFALPWRSYAPDPVVDLASRLNFGAWMANELFFEGTMRAIFSMLFGAGVLLLAEGAGRRGRGSFALAYYSRTVWLMIFGLVHGYILLWHGDILFPYGLVGLLLYPLRRLHPTVLMALGAFTLAMSIPHALAEADEFRYLRDTAARAEAAFASGAELSPEQIDARWEWENRIRNEHLTKSDVEFEIEQRRGDYLTNFDSLGHLTYYMQTVEMREFGFWDIAGMMLLGMAFFSWGIFSAERSSRFYGWMLILGYAIGLAINIHETFDNLANDFDPATFRENRLTYHAGRFFMAMGHVATLMLVCRAAWLTRVRFALAAVGRTALSNYVLQTVVCTLVFYGYGLGLFGALERYELLYVVAGVWAVELALSPLWLRYFRFGPLEWLWRTLTYWRAQPLLRS